jgi:hypothetical protein
VVVVVVVVVLVWTMDLLHTCPNYLEQDSACQFSTMGSGNCCYILADSDNISLNPILPGITNHHL